MEPEGPAQRTAGLRPATESGSPAASVTVPDRYRLVRQLGRGGMGAVFLVEDRVRGEQVALKQMYRRPDAQPEDLLAFRREFHTLTWLRHPRVVDVYDFGTHEGQPYYTMELLERGDLREIGHQPLQEVVAIVRDVASALAFVHSRKLIHRDLSTRNVRLGSDGVAKLIDFGLLATPGLSDFVGGTPPLVAPESLTDGPLDHRVDLFSLGALAYWLIAGRHAFPAKHLADLPELWKRRPPMPTRENEQVPEALAELVLALLSMDPLSRPSSAIEVIERLEAWFELPKLSREETGGYLVTPGLVGRDLELTRMRHSLRTAMDAQRTSGAVIEGVTGSGKSRLLQELSTVGQLAGGATLRIQVGEVSRDTPYALLGVITSELLAMMQADVVATARPHAPLLAHVLPQFLEHLPGLELTPFSGNPTEDRLVVQDAIQAWLSALLRRRRLVLLLDDVHQADEASISVLTSLLRAEDRAPLFLASTLRTDESSRAPNAVQALRTACHSVRLRALGQHDVRALVRAMFGDVEHVDRVADTVYATAEGIPQYCIEILRYLINNGQLQFVNGAWVLPAKLHRAELPESFSLALDARVAELSDLPLAVAQPLAVLDGRFSLALCARMLSEHENESLFSALDALVQSEILLDSGRSYRFAHGGVRKAVLRTVDQQQLQRFHLKAAEALAEQMGDGGKDSMRVGWHLYHGGREVEGAELLERYARELFAVQSLRDAIAPFEATLRAYETHHLYPVRCLEIRRMLLLASPLVERSLADRYAKRSIEIAASYAGLDLARRTKKWLGRPLALALGLTSAAFRRALTPQERRGPRLVQALTEFMLICSYSAATYAYSLQTASLTALRDDLDVLRVFRKSMPSFCWMYCNVTLAWIAGRHREMNAHIDRAIGVIEGDTKTPISHVERETVRSALLALRAGGRLEDLDPDWEGSLPSDKLRSFRASNQSSRAVYQRNRGDEAGALALWEDAELDLIQLGSVWTLEVIVLYSSAESYAQSKDVVGLRRCIEQMRRWQAGGVNLEDNIDLARGEYMREQGQLEAAEALLEALLKRSTQGRLRPLALAALAETQVARGRFEQAAGVAEEGLRCASDIESRRLVQVFRCGRILAQAEAGMGKRDAAAKRLEAALQAACEHRPVATILAPLHEACASLAIDAGDFDRARRHLRKMREIVEPTHNPALLGRAEAVRARLDRRRPGQPRSETTRDSSGLAWFTESDDAAQQAAALAECGNERERFSRGLALLAQSVGAEQGFLYREHGGELDVVAAQGASEATQPDAQERVETAIRRRVEAMRAEMTMTATPSVAEAEGRLSLTVLTDAGATETDDGPILLGALVSASTPLRQPDARLVLALGRALGEPGRKPEQEPRTATVKLEHSW